MFKSSLIAVALAACFLAPAAASAAEPSNTRPLSLQLRQEPARDGFRDMMGVEGRRSPAGVVFRDAVYGGIAGLAIGAGVALINGNDYGRDIAIGAGIGLLVGGVLGILDAASYANRFNGAAVDRFSANTAAPVMSGTKLSGGGRF